MFEIRLPSSLVNKADQKADKGGFVGTFFMALTLVLVSFSCTGPIVGIILIKASQGAVVEPMLGMFAFSLAFALPFTLFAIFPSWLKNLPQSGGWLNTVKVVLGFIEIALGLKFLSVADQTYHWGILDREVYIALWIVIFGLLAIYLLGKIKLAHDSDLPFIKVPRLFMAMGVLAFVVYLVPGLWGHPLKALSGYLPPISTHDFDLLGEIQGTDDYVCGEEPLYGDLLHLPHGIAGYFDYEQALACAKAQDKPLFIDFTGHGCVNCREMEAKVWSDPAVLKLLKEKFVVVALYADDKTLLSEEKWVESKVDGKTKKTIGDINLDFQICNFGESAQPLYTTLDSKENLLQNPVGYTDLETFKTFLENSIVEYNKWKKGKSPL
jgi:thiol:disulfide interchange protein DsbD